MRRAVFFVAIVMLGVVASAQTADVAGRWDLEMRWPDATSTGSCILQQEGERLTGSCGGMDRVPLTGRVEGAPTAARSR